MCGQNRKQPNPVDSLTGLISLPRTILSADLSAIVGTKDGWPSPVQNPSDQDKSDLQEPMDAVQILPSDLVLTMTGEIVDQISVIPHIAIIGTREPDNQQIEATFHLSWVLSCMLNCIVHTGAANGIDQVAMEGTRGKNLHVYLPWASFNRSIIPLTAEVTVYNPSTHAQWTDSVTRYHPAPHNLSHSAFALHARNYGIVSKCLGVIALPNERGEGGTAQGIRIAEALNIPCFIGKKGQVDAPRFISGALKLFKLVDPNLKPTIPGHI